MPLLGNGVLAIWNGITGDAEDEFAAWHVREHIPERVGVPGFLRGRRYVSYDGRPKYFNFYETAEVSDLSSAAYRARLNAPSDWTRRVVPHFRDTSRTVCRVAVSIGSGEGGWVETVRLSTRSSPAEFIAKMRPALSDLAAAAGIVATHLLEGQPDASSGASAEKAMRDRPDQVVAWVMLVEAVGCSDLERLRRDQLSWPRLADLGVEQGLERGIYSLQYGLSKPDLAS